MATSMGVKKDGESACAFICSCHASAYPAEHTWTVVCMQLTISYSPELMMCLLDCSMQPASLCVVHDILCVYFMCDNGWPKLYYHTDSDDS